MVLWVHGLMSNKHYTEKLVEDIRVFLKKKKKKIGNMVVNDTKFSQKMESKNYLFAHTK